MSLRISTRKIERLETERRAHGECRKRRSDGKAARNPARRRLEFLSLEERVLLCMDGRPDDLLDQAIGTFPPVDTFLPSASSDSNIPPSGPSGSSPLTSVPALNSLPGAAASLYLDFVGDYESAWGSYSNISTPAYDQDGDATTFSDGELASITQIWTFVSEDYAPLKINVTTVPPANFNNGVAEKVVIGGNGAWSGGTYGGISYVSSFTNSIQNVAFVFPANLSNGYPKYVGDASSHESGHAFGLQHQSQYSGSTKVAEYYSGPGDGTAPIMGNSYSAALSRWWYGQSSISSSNWQDDLAVISGSTNGFGYRADDHGNSASTSDPLAVSGLQVSGSGIIEKSSDVDAFSFTTGAGLVSLTVAVAPGVNNLVAQLTLEDSSGSTVVPTTGPDASYGASITATLTAGSFRLLVSSNGGYGNVGQYTLSGTVVAATDVVSAPTNLAANAVSTTEVDLTWTDNATTETGYDVERSTDGTTWTVLNNSLAANSTSYADTTGAAGTTYHYRVRAFNAITNSDYSNQASATTIPAAPGSLTATAISSARVDLAWNDVTGETGYSVERSLDGVTWNVVGSPGANATTYSDTTVSASTAYQYRVQAVNAAGGSAYSNVASATTPAAPALPAAPSGLVATANSSSQVTLNWVDNSSNEDGFYVDRSANGGKGWSRVGQVGSNVTTFTDTSVNARKTYLYRVSAFNAAGASSFSNVATVTMPSRGLSAGGGFGGLAHAAVDGVNVFARPSTNAETPALVVLTGSTATQQGGGGLNVVASGGTSAVDLVDQALAAWTSLKKARGLRG